MNKKNKIIKWKDVSKSCLKSKEKVKEEKEIQININETEQMKADKKEIRDIFEGLILTRQYDEEIFEKPSL